MVIEEIRYEYLRKSQVKSKIIIQDLTLMCRIVGGIIRRGLRCKINTIKGKGNNKRDGLG